MHQLRRVVLRGTLGRAGNGGGRGACVVARVAAIVVAVVVGVAVVVAVAGSAATLLLLQLTQSLLFLALLFAPLGTAILEPHLEGRRERESEVSRGLAKATFDRASKTLSSVFQIIFSIATPVPPTPPYPPAPA